MEQFTQLLSKYLPAGYESYMHTILISFVAFAAIAFLGRLLFGKKSTLNQSVSGLIGILFIYAITIVVYSYGIDLSFLVSPLPFVTLNNDYLTIFPILTADFTLICEHLLNMVILAFLVNLINGWLPTKKNVFAWLFFRCLSVAGAMLLFAVANYLMEAYLPSDFLKWAPVILLVILVSSLLLGALKLVVGAVLTTINPLLAVLYTFFFASVLGKQVSKAILTTVFAALLVAALNYFEILIVYVGAAALAAYIPLLLLLLVLWYIIGRKL
jgi:hypothetical protein